MIPPLRRLAAFAAVALVIPLWDFPRLILTGRDDNSVAERIFEWGGFL